MSKIDKRRYKVKLTRLYEIRAVKHPTKPDLLAENSTLGKIEVLDMQNKEKCIWQGFTCENGGPSSDVSGSDKRIVSRDYDMEWCESGKNASLSRKYPKFKRGERNLAIWITCDDIMPSIRKRLIRIHTGNAPQDTQACILIGKSMNKEQGWINNSVEGVKEFFETIEKIGIENCFLRVTDI